MFFLALILFSFIVWLFYRDDYDPYYDSVFYRNDDEDEK